MTDLEIDLAPHYETLASTSAESYKKIAAALQSAPLYHQWCTYMAKDAHIVVNSYNTGTGKTKAALLRLLDLDEAYRKDRNAEANVLFIAPTNELLRQHEQDIQGFKQHNQLKHIVLRLDAATIKELGQQHLGEKFVRQGDRLYQMLEDPRSVTVDSDGHHIEGHHPYILVINPDIFYYALYGLGNPHDQRVLFRSFVNNFQYIVIDEFHYYNAKQFANFLFFLTLCREWNHFANGRTVCLLTATPSQKVTTYLDRLNLKITYIAPGNEPQDLPKTPALAPVKLHLYSSDSFDNGLVDLATSQKDEVQAWLQQQRHGAFISSALWRINELYQAYGGKSNQYIGRLTGAETAQWRNIHKNAALVMATPTVDIGYNFGRAGKKRQSIDFLFFDARSSDECIQRLGRAARVLGKEISDIPSDVYAVVPDELLTELKAQTDTSKTIERSTFNTLINSILPQKNGTYAYIQSGAIAEAFLPLYYISKASSSTEKQLAERLYQAIAQIYAIKKVRSFASLAFNIQKYLKIKRDLLDDLLRDAKQVRFTFGRASVIVRTMDDQPGASLEDLNTIDTAQVCEVEAKLRKDVRKIDTACEKRIKEIEEYYTTDARFNFRDNFQPLLAQAYDPKGFLATAEYTAYSALHILQNYIATWYDSDQPQFLNIMRNSGQISDKQVQLCCEIKKSRDQRLRTYFKLGDVSLTKMHWEERYCSTLAATKGFRIFSDDGQVPVEINTIFAQNYVTFYAVPAIGPEAAVLNNLSKTTLLFTNTLCVDFGDEGEHEYMFVVGTAALLLAYERSVVNTKYMVKRAATQRSHIFDWEYEE